MHRYVGDTEYRPSTITNVLSGRRQISKENITKLATYFRVAPSVFLSTGY